MTTATQVSRFQIKSWKPYIKNSLQGFLDVECQSGMIIHGCTLFQKGASRWIGLPSKQFKKDDGSTSYTPIIEFKTREQADAFRDGVVEAFDDFQGTSAR